MTRIRRLGAEFLSYDDIKDGTPLNLSYLSDYKAWQEYLDDNLDILFERHSVAPAPNESQSVTDDMTGYGLYRNNHKALWRINYFKSIIRAYLASVFESAPTPIDPSPDIAERWKREGRALIREVEKAVEWRIAKGRGVLLCENQVAGAGVEPVFSAVDPAGYLPIRHPRNPDYTIAHMFATWYRVGERLPYSDLADRVDLAIFCDERGAALSDGRMKPINVVRSYGWNADRGGLGTFGAFLGEIPGRILGAWTFGDDDSLFGATEDNVFEAIIALSNSRTTLTRDVRSIVIVPNQVDERNLNAVGQFVIDKLNPVVQIPPETGDGGSKYGYVEPPGPLMAEAYRETHNTALQQIAYTANLPPTVFAEGYQPGEPAEAVRQLTVLHLTYVVDIRDDLSPIMSEGWALTGGPSGVDIGWEQAPYVDQEKVDERAIRLRQAGAISQATLQAMVGVPIEPVDEPQQQQQGGDPDGGN